MFYFVEKIVIAIACYVDIYAIGAWFPELNPEAYIAMASGVIAVIALWANIREGKETRKHNRLLVRPVLFLRISDWKKIKVVDGQEINVVDEQGIKVQEFKIIIANNGTGTALIKRAIKKVGGERFEDNDAQKYNEALEKALKELDNYTSHYFSTSTAIKAGEEIVFISFEYTAEEKKIEALKKIMLSLEYQSIYEEEIDSVFYEYNSKTH